MTKNNNEKEYPVKALENGTVIDHIPSDKLFNVVELLHLDTVNTMVTIGNNLSSKNMGKKGIIKIADKFYCEEQINRIALIAPYATINIIRDYKVTKKMVLTLPDELIGLVSCPNPKCITNNEPMKTRFNVLNKNHLTIKCEYCEKEIEEEDIKLKNN